jgi:hypothetical protein
MDSAELARLNVFSGKAIVATGGTEIRGRALASAPVGCRAIIGILDRNMDSAKHVLDPKRPRAHQAMVVRADMVNQDSLLQAAKSSKARFGTESILLPVPCAECLA